VELSTIVERFAAALVEVDTTTQTLKHNQRTKEPYLPGVITLSEVETVSEVRNIWLREYPMEFQTPSDVEIEFQYPNIPRARCDLVFSSDGLGVGSPEWAIEVKRIQFVGDNGNNNDFNVQKILSPYLKDRSLIHDIHNLKTDPIGRRQAVLGYCFEYDFESCDEALARHPAEAFRIKNLRSVCKKNDPQSGELHAGPILSFADQIFVERGLATSLIEKSFENAWRHPCGGKGRVFAWEVPGRI